jgi:hypothetical protein
MPKSVKIPTSDVTWVPSDDPFFLDGEFYIAWAPGWRRSAMCRYKKERGHWVNMMGAKVKPVLVAEIPVPPAGA